jgi:hypothetical protein
LNSSGLYVLRFAIPEGPILFDHFNQADKDVFLSHLEARVQAVGYGLVEALFHLDRSSAIQRDLHKNAIIRSMHTEKFAIELQADLWMLGDDLEEVSGGRVHDVDQRLVNNLTNLFAKLWRSSFCKINANEGHVDSLKTVVNSVP